MLTCRSDQLKYHPAQTRDPSHLKLKVIKTFRKSLERQACEATRISHNDADIPMNSRSEFHQPSIPRVTVMRGLGSWDRAELNLSLAVVTWTLTSEDPHPVITNLSLNHQSFCCLFAEYFHGLRRSLRLEKLRQFLLILNLRQYKLPNRKKFQIFMINCQYAHVQ